MHKYLQQGNTRKSDDESAEPTQSHPWNKKRNSHKQNQ